MCMAAAAIMGEVLPAVSSNPKIPCHASGHGLRLQKPAGKDGVPDPPGVFLIDSQGVNDEAG
jgi:hypothetical protein